MPAIARFSQVSAVGILLMFGFIAPNTAWADAITITFQDSTETLTVTIDNNGTQSTTNCPGEFCSLPLSFPPGSEVAFNTVPMFFALAEPNTSPQVLSDSLVTFISTFGTLAILSFSSDNDSTPSGLCSDTQMFPSGCKATETDSVHVGT